MLKIAPQWHGHLPQALGVPVDLGCATERHVQQEARFAWKGIRLNRFALYQARIARRGFLTWRPAVDQDNLKPALLQMQGGARANHACAKNKDAGSHAVAPVQG